MKAKDMFQLQPGASVTHKRYGAAVVERVIPDFGVVIQPTTETGRALLASDSGGPADTPLLEDSPRQLSV